LRASIPRRPPARSRRSTAASCDSRACSCRSATRAAIGSRTTSRCRSRRSRASSARVSCRSSTPTATTTSSRVPRSCVSATARCTPSTRASRPPTICSKGADAMRTSRLLAGLLVLGFAALLVPSVDAQKRGGTLTIVRPTDPVSLDPNLETTAPGAWVYFNMLEGLLTLDEKMQIKPALATSYEVMSPTKVRFKLRSGVKFHDGTPFNAEAVKFTFDRALKGTPPARWASLAGSLSHAEVVDNLTVDVVTREPYGPILRTLAMYCMGIVSPTAVGKMGPDFSRAPVGTGPFKFVEWKTNTHVIIERNPDYWGDKALVDRVVFKVVPEEGARTKALLAQAGFTPGPDGIMQKGGQRLSLSWLSQRGRYPKDGEITEAIQAMFKDVGVEAKVQFLEWGTVFPQLRGNPLNHHMF